MWAADVAEFFSTLHSLKGDAGRSWGGPMRPKGSAIAANCANKSTRRVTKRGVNGCNGRASQASRYGSQPDAAGRRRTGLRLSSERSRTDRQALTAFLVCATSAGLLYHGRSPSRWMGAYDYRIYVFDGWT